MKKLSVIIPAYNEEHRIGSTLGAIHNYLSKQNYEYEIIVVIDGAKDKTAEVVSGMQSQIKNLTVLNNKQNHGKGWVVRQGMLQAVGEYRLFTDADNSTSIEQVEKFFPFMSQGYDIVIGSIEVEGAQINEHAQWYRRFLGHWSKLLIRVVAGVWQIHDTQRGFKLFTAKAAERIFFQAKIDRFGFDIEILAAAVKCGYKIKEVPVVWNNAGESTVSLKSYLEVFKDLLRVRWYLWTGKYK
ncbi:MAG: glycosyltransferase family 2 protein [Candidatus Doudnabacteria bacterium]|nr:glycosyltransferase family 2 protein [Candidatus Doudnabacteria bacterium]